MNSLDLILHSLSTDQPTQLLVPKGTPLLTGKMYLRLYHGRNDPAEDMEDWGFAGPTFGPLSCYVHTYCGTFRIYGDCDTCELWLEWHDNMIRWEECFYGDMEVFVRNPAIKDSRIRRHYACIILEDR